MMQPPERNNPVYESQALSFLPPRTPGEGTELLPDGSVRLRIRAPFAASLRAVCHVSRGNDFEVALRRTDGGVFEGVLPYRADCAGTLPLRLSADGGEFLSPALPILWCGDRPSNYVELPDPANPETLFGDIPHGAVSLVPFFSRVLERPLRCAVYTPPDFSGECAQFPALYLLHGGTENELAWVSAYKLPNLLDSLFFAGRAVPFVAVMVNAMVRFPHGNSATWDGAPGSVLLRDVIPQMETRFRLKPEKQSRALAGLSMGAYLTNDIGLAHPEVFGSLGQFTGCMYHETDTADYERPYLSRMAFYEKNPQAFAEDYRVFFRSTTPLEDHFSYFLEDDRICRKAGIDRLPCFRRIVYPPQTGKCSSWRSGLRDFAQLLFRGSPA